jgi:hypothetical protein
MKTSPKIQALADKAEAARLEWIAAQRATAKMYAKLEAARAELRKAEGQEGGE